MANEAVLIFETGHPINMIAANSVAIEKGSLLVLDDPFTCSGSQTLNGVPAGIAAVEKIASDGNTNLAVYREGIFKVTVSGSCTAGDAMVLSETDNMVAAATTSGSNVIGIVMEDATTAQTALMELKIFKQTNLP